MFKQIREVAGSSLDNHFMYSEERCYFFSETHIPLSNGHTFKTRGEGITCTSVVPVLQMTAREFVFA